MKQKKTNFSKILLKRFSALLIIVLMVVTVFVSVATYHIMLQRTISSKKNELTLINQRIGSLLSYAKTIGNLLYYNDYLFNYFQKENITQEDNQEISDHLKLRKGAYKALTEDFGIGFDIILVGENGMECWTNPLKGDFDSTQITQSEWLKKSILQQETEGDAINVMLEINGKRNPYYVRYRNIYSPFQNHTHYLGTMCVIVNISYFENSYAKLEFELGDVFLYNDNNELFLSEKNNEDNRIKADQIMEETDKQSIINGNDLVIRDKSSETEWTIVEVLSLEVLKDQLFGLILITILICAVAVICGLVMVLILSRAVTRPLREFCTVLESDSLQSLEQVGEENSTIEELDQLYDSYNQMHGRNVELLDRLIEKEQEKKVTELNYLRAQINPHFIYNTLFSIKCTVDMGKREEAVKMIGLLNDILRSSLRFTEETTLIGNELSYIHNYVKILRFSYDKKIDLRVEVSEEVQSCKILRFLLQPIVENAVFHGIQPKNEDGLIVITAKKNCSKIELIIYDNGIGFSKERMEEVTSPEYMEKKGSGHVGMYNVHNRIRQYYGEEYGLVIDTNPGDGTTIYITIPIVV